MINSYSGWDFIEDPCYTGIGSLKRKNKLRQPRYNCREQLPAIRLVEQNGRAWVT